MGTRARGVDQDATAVDTAARGLELVEVWYRPENAGKSNQYEIFNSFQNSAINVHYAFGADAGSMRNASRKFIHIEPLQCFNVHHLKGETLYILDWECPDLQWKEENLAGTGKKAWPPNYGVSKTAAEVYERGTTRASEEQIRACVGDLVRGQGEDVAIVYWPNEKGPKTLKIFNDYNQRIRVEYYTQAFGEDIKPAKPCLIEPFACYTAKVPSGSTPHVTAVHPE